jgi:UDP-N-acetylglucosamine 2-epimerase (non-hydrolysing)
MKKLKVMTIIGTRPEIIRLSRTLSKLDEYCDHTLVHTGQNYDYELNQIFFEDLEIRKPDYFLNSAVDSKSVADTIGKLITCIDALFAEVMPDAILVLGDTNSCLSVIPAKRRKIPIFHMEAGNRCFDMRVPEEINRRIIDHTSDVNLTYSNIARDYLLREGLPADLIIKTGSPMSEVLTYYRPMIDQSNILDRLKLKEDNYFLVSIHREENVDLPINFTKLCEVLNVIAEEFDLPVILSTHPRTQKCISEAGVKFHRNISINKPLGFFDYVKLQLSARATLSDSGTINEESAILNFPALNLRETHERPEAMEEAAVMMVGLEIDRIRQGLHILSSQSGTNEGILRRVPDYCALNVSDKVVRIIHSYVDYVNRVIWKKY